MITIPPMRLSKTNWLNFHCNHCSSLITNRFKTIIGDSIAAALNRYRSVWTKYLEPRKTLNCGIWGDRVHVFILCGTKNLFQGLPEDIADGITQIAQTWQSKDNSINIPIGGILLRDASWPINRVLIKEAKEV